MDIVGESIDGIRSSRVFSNAVDFDASSMYPSIIRAYDIDPEAQIGTILFKDENGTPELCPEFMEVLLTCNPVEIGSKYFNLPRLDELLKVVEEVE